MDLVYKNEKTLFTVAALISGLFWLLLIGGTLGIVLIYFLLGYLFFLFAHSAFISYLKGTGVKITEEQYPDLHQRLLDCCEKVGQKDIPEAYLLRTDFFNALATRFLGRHFVVLFTDVVDALEDRPEAVNFYIGHEIGHIHRRHLFWSPFLMPASILPLLGAALRRAEEYTCDRYGAACCETEEDIQSAIAAIAAGDSRWKTINIDAYLKQIHQTNGFWMSFNELTSDYPWLTKRMAAAVGFHQGKAVKMPRRHGFAWFLSLFVPRIGVAGGGLVSIMIVVAVVGILASVAIPAYQDYVERTRMSAVYMDAERLSKEVDEYVEQHNQWPADMQSLGYTSVIENFEHEYSLDLYEKGNIVANVGFSKTGEERYLILEPAYNDGIIDWTCYGDGIHQNRLPRQCQ